MFNNTSSIISGYEFTTTKFNTEKSKKKISGNLNYERRKSFADKYSEARYQIEKESDPLKREKMTSRLALGVTDFSDL